jgi:hypothetical protein
MVDFSKRIENNLNKPRYGYPLVIRYTAIENSNL